MPKVPTKAQKPAGPPPTPRRVLVLDDNPADRALMAALLRHAGCWVLEGTLAGEMAEFPSPLPPALLIIDIFLPAPSGAELIRKLRRTAAFAETPILAVSAAGTDAVRHLALEAGTGLEALTVAAATAPELILLDLRLPDAHGFDLAQRLRAEARTASIPILALTAYPGDHAAEALAASGCTGYLTKPISRELLREALRHYLPER